MSAERIRIVYTAHSLSMGGAEKVALDLMQHLDVHRFHVFLVIRDSVEGDSTFESAVRNARARGMTVIVKPARRLLPADWQRRSKAGKLLGLLPFAIRIAREIRDEFRTYRRIRPQIIHLHKVLGFEPYVKKLVARAAGVPVVITTYHQFPLQFANSRYHRVHGWLDNALKRTMDYLTLRGLRAIDDAMIATSPEERDAHIQCGIPADKIVVISNGIDLSRYEAGGSDMEIETLRARLGIPPGSLIIGHVARLSEVQKAQSVLIDAAIPVLQQFSNAYLVIVGDGDDRGPLQDRIAGAPPDVRGRIVMPGKVQDTAVAAFHFLFDIFVLSSRFEGQGLVNMEAMAAGTPIVATRVGGVPSTVGNDAALLVDPDDAVALADAIRKLAADGDLRRRMGDAGRILAFRRYRIERTAHEHEVLYQDLLRRSQREPLTAARA